MSTMTIRLPDPLKDWIDEHVRREGFDDAGDFVAKVLQKQREKEAKIANMQVLIEESIASGVSDRTAEEIIADARARRQAEKKS